VQPSGACFTIELPYQRAAALEDEIPAGAVVAARGGRILLIDHDESVLEAVEAILREGITRCGLPKLSGSTAASGEQEFDAVVADAEVRAAAGGEGLQEC